MRKFTFYIFSAICLFFCITACTLETSDNGDLDGYWQLNSIDSLPAATSSRQEVSVSMVPKRIFWAVQGKLLQTRDIVNNRIFYLRFDHQGEQLTVLEPHREALVSDTTSDQGDPLLTDATPLQPLGINATWTKNGNDSTLSEKFSIIELNGDKMVLEGNKLRLHFVKF